MSGYSGMILTKAGLALQAQAQIGGQLIITRLAIGDGLLANGESEENLTALKHQVMSLGIQDMQVITGGQSRIRALLTNDNITNGFFVREIGVFAKIGATGAETLYSYTNASDKADYLPSSGINAVEEVLEIYIIVGNAQNVTCNINDRVTLATKQDIVEHKTASTLDHPDNSVTDAKIGNRTIIDTTAPAGTAGTLTTLLGRIGNMIKSITGKANWYTAPATTLEAANAHLQNTSNPHNTTAAQVGAVNKNGDNMTGDLVLCSNTVLRGKDTSGAVQWLAGIAADNQSYFGNDYTNMMLQSKTAIKAMIAGVTKIVATTDMSFVDRGLVPKNWDDAKLIGTYVVHPAWTPGQINSAVEALGLYHYGQLVLFNTTNDASIQKIYFSHKGEVAIKQNYGGDEKQPWKQLATTDKCGVSIGTIIPFLATKAQPGWLALDTGALVSRASYPDLWTWVQANAPLITEAEWQAQAAVQSSVGYYSSGDGSTTFRLPRIVDFVRGSDGTRLPGNWQGDALQNIVGSTKIVQITDYSTGSGAISTTNTYNTSISIGGGNGERKDLTFDASRVARTADETRPKSISMLYCVKAFDAPTNQGMVDITALANSLANKIDKNDIGYGTRVWISNEYAPVLNTPTIVTHGLNINPLKCKSDVLLKCVTADNGYSPGDFAISPIEWPSPNQTEYPFAPTLTITTIQQNTGYSGMWSLNKANGIHYQLDLTKWRYIFRIWY
jgi:hypothetical protein